VRKFKNKRKKQLVYEYIIQLEESTDDFLYVPFEKNITTNNLIMDVVRNQIDVSRSFKVKSYRNGSANCKVEIENLELKVILPEKLNFESLSNIIKTQ